VVSAAELKVEGSRWFEKSVALKRAIEKYLRPQTLCLDEVGYLAVDQGGADLRDQPTI
jgi:hypothetical protein